MSRDTLDAAYFARVYANDSDPWKFATSAYEREKYDATLRALGDVRFARVLEIGASIGVLTERLARACDALVALELDPTALAAARERNRHHAHVTFERAKFPDDAPPGPFDLVVVSEVAYYWSDDDFARARATIAALAPGGTVVLVHFTPVVDDYPRTGDDVHDAFLADPRFAHRFGSRAARYRLDVVAVR